MRGNFHNCNDAQNQMAAYVDGALCETECQEFVNSLRNCPRCAELLEHQKSFKVFLQNKMPVKAASSNLLQNVRSCMRSDNNDGGYRR